jgi:hypothetical protein
MWQPLREITERLLIEYDWGKSFIAVNMVLKPLLDELFLVKYAKLFRLNGDDLMAEMLENLYLDTVQSKEWSLALTKLILELHPDNRLVVEETINEWYPLAYRAISGFAPAFEELSPIRVPFAQVLEDILEKYQSMLADIQITSLQEVGAKK